MNTNHTNPATGGTQQPPLLDLNVTTLAHLQELRTERDKLTLRVAEIDREWNRLLGPAASLVAGGLSTVSKSPGKRRPKGSVQDSILECLTNAGPEGVSTTEIIEKTGLDRTAIDRWLFSGSAKLRHVSRVGRGVYKIQPPTPAAAPKKRK